MDEIKYVVESRKPSFGRQFIGQNKVVNFCRSTNVVQKKRNDSSKQP